MKLVSVQEMRRIEQAADAGGHAYATMMEFAGQAVADVATALQLAEPGERVLVLVGPGNNGGDGLVAARFLRERDIEITLYIWKRDIKGDANFRKLKQRRRGTTILWADNDPGCAKLREEIGHSELIIDALLGTGAARPIDGQLAEILTAVKEEIIARRTFEPEPGPEVLGIPRFPLMEALSLGAPVPPRPAPAEFDDDDLFDPDFDSAEGSDLSGLEGMPGNVFDEDEDGAEWEDEETQPLPWPELPVLAVDCPSGLNCDSGALDPAAIPAAVTVTFACPKWGQLQFPGAGACGLLAVADIGVPEELIAEIVAELTVELVGPEDVQRWLPPRPMDAHKGTFGKALIAGGSLNYTGAAYLSAAAATRAGAGLVTLAIPLPLHAALAGVLPEVTWLPLPGPEGVHTAAGAAMLLHDMDDYDALLVGPGLTSTEDAQGFVETIFSSAGLPKDEWSGLLVVDADALNLLAKLPDWPGRLPPGSILTPHPGEMARLTGMTIRDVNARRIENARRWAAEWGHIVLLKGPHTVIAAPDGRTAVLPFALPVLATAGSGDVLAGAIVAMLAQGVPAFEASLLGAYLHGQAGLLISRTATLVGVVARDILASFPEALRQLYTSH
jgi:ADP-dependent NAD(P)H-hydrate dehydratase / NAD(P)H-hydrate epimerase